MDKIFFVACFSAEEDVTWSTEDYTEEELITIQKFLEDLNGRVDGTLPHIEAIVIMDEDSY